MKILIRPICGCLLSLLFVAASVAEEDLLIADFEQETYGSWKTTGEAFGDGPAQGTLPGQMTVSGFKGKGLVNSFVGGDQSTGTLTSPSFEIKRDYINFLVGGGAHDEETCINLLVDDQVVHSTTGPNDRSGGSERLDWATWEVKSLRGKRARIQIVDRHTGGWGHINVDHITQSNKRAVSSEEERTREVALANQYLVFPIDNDAPATRLRIVVDGQLIQNFDINLANEKIDWWSHLDVSRHQGQKATLTVDRLPGESEGLVQVTSSDAPRHQQPLYDEALRPQLRFSQMRGWCNDPNGMVYHEGEYHFFWQSNPFGPQWANMFWGHAVSKDLIHWQELPVALKPRTFAVDMCFSGSAHVDEKNTGGWQIGEEKVMVAAFTDTGAGEALAISRDRGRSWEYIEENPIIKHQGRDPKLIWYEPKQHWVIAVYTEIDGKQMIAFHKSDDLKNWKLTSHLDGFFECPELFELPVEGTEGETRWVIFGADTNYLVGDFDGETFHPEHQEKRQLHYGPFYASQCFNRTPDGRVIQVGWTKIETPGMPFNQTFSLPTELTLHQTPEGIRLRAKPIEELRKLRQDPLTSNRTSVSPEDPVAVIAEGQLFDVEVTVDPKTARRVALRFGENQVVYDVAEEKLDGMPLPLIEGLLSFRVVIDRPQYEVVGGEGEVYQTAARRDGGKPIPSIQLTAEGGPAEIKELKVYPMESIWRNRTATQ